METKILEITLNDPFDSIEFESVDVNLNQEQIVAFLNEKYGENGWFLIDGKKEAEYLL